MLEFVKVLGLFAITALAEILGCYLPWLVLTQQRSPWLLIPAAVLGAVCLAADPAPRCRRANLRSLQGCLRGDCPDLAMADRWRSPNPMGSCRQRGLAGRYGDHHAPTGSSRLNVRMRR